MPHSLIQFESCKVVLKNSFVQEYHKKVKVTRLEGPYNICGLKNTEQKGFCGCYQVCQGFQQYIVSVSISRRFDAIIVGQNIVVYTAINREQTALNKFGASNTEMFVCFKLFLIWEYILDFIKNVFW